MNILFLRHLLFYFQNKEPVYVFWIFPIRLPFLELIYIPCILHLYIAINSYYNYILKCEQNQTYSWEQRKLSECAGFRRGSFPQPYGNKEWYDGEGAMPFVQVADVADDMKLVDDTKQKISKLAQPMSVYADKGSVLVTLQGSIGRVAITQYGAFVDRTVLIFDKYNQDIDKTFWAYIIKEKFIDEARKAPGGTIKTITKEALSDFDLMLPNYDEQKKLGAFLVSIDNLITLQQREHSGDKVISNLSWIKISSPNQHLDSPAHV